MDRIYDDAKDKNVAAVIIHAKGSDGKAWKDADGTDQFKTSELQDAFNKRALIHYGTDTYYVPTGFAIASKIGKISFAVSTGIGDSAKTEIKTLAAVAD